MRGVNSGLGQGPARQRVARETPCGYIKSLPAPCPSVASLGGNLWPNGIHQGRARVSSRGGGGGGGQDFKYSQATSRVNPTQNGSSLGRQK